MGMSVMEIGEMTMAMHEMDMAVRMGVRFRASLVVMAMLVMRVMDMQMIMLHLFMLVGVLVLLRQVQPEAHGHQNACRDEDERDWIAQQRDRDTGTDERRQ
jgi:hypothetical protein